MTDQDRDPVSLDDSYSALRSDERARRLCIVSSKPLLCSPFMAALRTVLTPHDALEIIVDRRRERVPTEARPNAPEQPSVDRRRHPQVDRQVKIDGFASVPVPAAGSRARRSPISLLLPKAPAKEVSRIDLEDEERLEGVRNFQPGLGGWPTTWLVLVGLLVGLMSAVVTLFALPPAVKTLVSRLRPEASSSQSLSAPPRQDKQTPPEAHAASVAANAAEVKPSSPLRGEPSPSEAAPEFPATGRASETSAAAPVAPNPRATAPPSAIARVTTSPITSPIANAPPSDTMGTGITSSRFPGLPRVEVLSSTAAAWSQGGTYAVQISDPAGRPLAGADVLLSA